MSDAPKNPWGDPGDPGDAIGGQSAPPPSQPGQGAYPPPQGQPTQPGQQAYPPPQGQPAQPGQYQAAGGPAYGAPVAPPVKKSKAKPILLGCGGVTLLALLLVGGCLFLLRDEIGDGIDLVQGTIEGTEFVTDVDEGNWAGARARVSDSCPAALSALDQLEADGFDTAMSGFEITGDVEGIGGDTIDLTGSATVDGSSVPISVEVIDDDGWQVCNFNLDG